MSFAYDAAGRLASVTDTYGSRTAIQRAGAAATAIVAPHGQRTTLTSDAAGNLATITNPGGSSTVLGYSTNSLLTSLLEPSKLLHTFSYDSTGRLLKDQDATGTSLTLARTNVAGGYDASITTALGVKTTYAVRTVGNGTQQQTTIEAGVSTVTSSSLDGTSTVTEATGTTVTTSVGPDKQVGMQTPAFAKITTRMPSGLQSVMISTQTVTLADAANASSLVRRVDSARVNGALYTSTLDRAQRTVQTVSPSGRVGTLRTDSLGRIVEARTAGTLPLEVRYDSRGRVTGAMQGDRSESIEYGADGLPSRVVDILGRPTTLTRDSAGRVLAATSWDGRMVRYGYNESGDRVSLTPAGRSAHRFDYTTQGLLASYTAPSVREGESSITRYTYDSDRRLASIIRPDGQQVGFTYDAAGRSTMTSLRDDTTRYVWDGTTGLLSSIFRKTGGALAFTYDGALVTGITVDGPARGTLRFVYDPNFRLVSLSVNGALTALEYDLDGLLTRAGGLAIARGATTGWIMGTTVNQVTTRLTYDSFGMLSADTATAGSQGLFAYRLERDALGRIVKRVETVLGETRVYGFTYDSASRLADVTRDGQPTARHEYDSNGNRVRVTRPTGITAGVYDSQDRLLSFGGASYVYGANGELRNKIVGQDTTRYRYDALGNLRSVALPDGSTLEYLTDALDRRVARILNGQTTQLLLYGIGPAPVAELDQSGVVRSRFVYGSRPSVPDYMIRGDTTFRFITDHLGSVRLVVDAASGVVAQRLDYDEYGRVTTDTKPAFQPFGFAGGLYDPATGLVRFGARDYDATAGRWTAKDPVGFAGGSGNLYEYVRSDPMNLTDPSGLAPIGACWQRLLKSYFPSLDLNRVDVQAGIPKIVRDHAAIVPGAVTIGHTIYLDTDYFGRQTEVGKVALLGHELTHVTQYQALGFGGLLQSWGNVMFISQYFGEYGLRRLFGDSENEAYEKLTAERAANKVQRKILEDLKAKFPNGLCGANCNR